MKLIKIKNGTYGHRPEPFTVELKTAGDPPFEVSDSEADRLVTLGVAAIAFGEDSESLQDAMNGMTGQLEGQPLPPDDPDDPDGNNDDLDADGGDPEDPEGEPESGEDEGTEQAYTSEELEKMTNPQLAKLAEALGVHTAPRTKKADIIAAIMEAQSEDDELPDLGAADPE